jgi:thiol-disulfide isomerase/thioredoxin
MPRLCLIAIVIVTAALAGCKSELAPPAGDIAASLTLSTLDGAPFDPATLRGKPTVLLFWRVGCSYCMREMPIVAQVARDKGAAAVAVMVAGNKDKAKDIAKGFDGTVLVDEGALRERFGIKKVPYTLVLRGDGTAARAFLGEQSASTIASALDRVD